MGNVRTWTRAIGLFALLTSLATAGPGGAGQRGTLDHRFGGSGDGIATADTGRHESANAVAPLDDGRILIAGPASDAPEGATERIALAAFRPDGRLDGRFGERGTKSVRVNGDGYGIPVLAAPGGRIVVVDATTGRDGLRLRRIRADGSPDRTFGRAGVSIYRPADAEGVPWSPAWGTTIATVRRDGAIIVLSGTGAAVTAWTGPAGWAVTLTRFNPDGSVDRGFGIQGQATLPAAAAFPGGGLAPEAVNIDRRGNILVAGMAWAGVFPFRAFVARFRPDGMIDDRFGNGGIALGSGSGSWFEGLEVAPDGSILAATSSPTSATVERFSNAGLADASFGTEGSVTYETLPGEQVTGLARTGRPGGFVLVTDRYECTPRCAGGLLAYRSDGTIDRSFGREGRAAIPMEDTFAAAAMRGWIYVSGGVSEQGDNHDLALARVTS